MISAGELKDIKGRGKQPRSSVLQMKNIMIAYMEFQQPKMAITNQKQRIMFGDRDRETYLNKLFTSARTRTRAGQKIRNEFYEKEHTKPLFRMNDLLTVHNMCKYTAPVSVKSSRSLN